MEIILKKEIMNPTHVKEATALALLQYEEAWQHNPHLIHADIAASIEKHLNHAIKNELAIVLLEEDKVIAFMAPYGPINGCFGKDKGLFVPDHGHGSMPENRKKIYQLLLKEAIQHWVSKEIFSINICTKATDETLLNFFFVNGFGMRCSDLMLDIDRTLKNKHVGLIQDHLTYEKATTKEMTIIYDYQVALIQHLNDSPVIFPVKPPSFEAFSEVFNHPDNDFWVLKSNDDVIGYLKLSNSGETIISGNASVKNICGAYMPKKYRSKGYFESFMFAVIQHYKDTHTHIGVDCETINPEAFNFWSKHFNAYTYSLSRRLDERS